MCESVDNSGVGQKKRRLKTFISHQVDRTFFLRNAIQFAHDNSYGLAIWKHPSIGHCYISINTNAPKKGKIKVETSDTGFCFSPFKNNELNETLFFESSILYSLKDSLLTPIKADDTFETFYLNNKDTNKTSRYYNHHEVKDTLKTDYINGVSTAKQAIEHTDLKKVIVSKVKTKNYQQELDVVAKFEEITTLYPNAFVSLVSSPETGTWMGASPEILISIDKNKQFKTVALAGTQSHDTSKELKTAVWTQKEIEEQALVSRYITHCLKSIRIREFEDIGPKTVKAGNLLHLKTEFHVNMHEVDFPHLGTQMLELLHPTSAVCGMPKQNALDFIDAYEQHDRSFYSGFLGPVNVENETNIYVNLRCVEITQSQLVFYAGAGITEDSDPEKEWIETEQKCAILGDIFN